MSKLIFDLKDTGIIFNSFEVLTYERNKNSPSIAPLRGKGSMFFAENFSYVDKFVIKFKIKNSNNNYNSDDLTDLQKLKKLYSKYRIKGLVFLENEEIFNKIFAGLIYNENENFIKTSIKLLSSKESILSKKEFDDLEKETKELLFKLNMLNTFQEAIQIFPDLTNGEYLMLKKKYEKEYKVNSMPFLTCLHKLSFATIPNTSDGLEAEMTIGVVKDLINFDEQFIQPYKDKESEYSNFYNEIDNAINSFSNLESNLNLHFIDNSKTRLHLNEKQKDLNDVMNKSYLNEHDININKEDISQFQFITYNNIAEIPIQGHSSTLKQVLGVGESNLTVKILFKNDKAENFQKLKMINSLINKEQRQLKGIINFPFVNSLDFKSIELSDFFYSNDSDSDAVFATLILKLNAYNNQGIEINSFGETVDETFSATTKNRTANIPIIYSSFYYLNKILLKEDLSKLKDFVIESNDKETFTYKDLWCSYFNNSKIPDLYKYTIQERYQKLSDEEKLNEYSNIFNQQLVDISITDSKTLDILGLLPLIDFLNNYLYIGFETDSFTVDEIKNNLSNYKNIFNDSIKSIYNESLYYIVQSMFPSLSANIEIDNYYFNETVKVVILDYLTSLPVMLTNYINEIKINNLSINELFKQNIYFNDEQNQQIVNKIIIQSFKNLINRLKDEDLINKIITGFNLNKIQNEQSFNSDSLPVTIEDITKNVFNSLNRIEFELNNYLNSSEEQYNQVIEIISNQILSISKLRQMAYHQEYYDFYDSNQQIGLGGDYKKFIDDTKNLFNKVDIISLSVLGVLCNSFGISNSYFGFIHNISAEKIIDIGIKSVMLAANTDSKELIFDNIETLFGKDFCTKNGAFSFYNALTSNIALTDLGSYLGIYCKDNSNEYSAIFNVLINTLINDNYVNKAKKEYFNLLEDESNSFYLNTTEIKDSIADLYTQLKDDIAENKKIIIENKIKEYQESIVGYDKISQLYDAQFNNKNTYLKNFNSKDLRIKRIKSMTMGLDYLNRLNETFSPNLEYSLPTYDIYIFQKSNYFNSSSRVGIQKIENYLGIDKVIDLNIGFSEATRSKVAIIKTIDTSESVKPYNFKLQSNINIGLESVDQKIKNSTLTDYYSKTKQELKIGDEISIYMGYCNENKIVFTGIINKITEGKVKVIECVNYSYQLNTKTFDLNVSENLAIVDPINTFNRIRKETFNSNLESLRKTKENSININDMHIPSNLDNQNFNNILKMNEKVSTYNLIFYGLASNINSMKNFYNTSTPKLVELKTNSQDWNDINFYNAWWKKNKSTLENYFVQNINNVDRDASYYGVELKVPKNRTTSVILESTYNSKNSNTKLLSPASTYIINDNMADGTRYESNDITMKDLLCDMEKRIPGVYWDVLESGYGATLFYGRSNYNIYLKKAKADYEFSKTESNYFELKFNEFKENIVNMNKLNLFFTLKQLVDYTLGDSKDYNNKKDSGKYLDNSDYEQAQNVIFAVTNKNLISSKIEINGNVVNKIKMKYTSSTLQKIKNLFNVNTMFSTTTYAFGSLIDIEDDEVYANRIKEKVVEDKTISTTRQSVESSIARLQMELENYYTGKIIILFNPNIRYRSEVILFDSVNNIYGSILVKDFEHKFDNRGSYTIITPMMKIESLNVSKDTFMTSFWTRLFYNRDSEQTNANKLSSSLDAIYKNNKSILNTNFLFDFAKLKTESTPIIMNNMSLTLDDKNKGTYQNLSTVGLQPLVFYPLIKRNEYLLPDSDIYSVQQRKHFEKLTHWFDQLKTKTTNLFKFQKEYQNTMEQNILQKTYNYFIKRGYSLFNPKNEEITRLNFDTILGLRTKTELDKYRFEQMKKVMFDDLYDFNLLAQEIPTKQYDNKNSFAFFNTKILHYNSDTIKYDNIIQTISNFDFMALVEISDYNSIDNKKGGSEIIKKIGDKIIKSLNKSKNDLSYNWVYDSPVMIREDAMTHNKTQADEYSLVIRKSYLNQEDKNHIIFNIDKPTSITVNVNPIDNLGEKNITINIPVYNIVCKNNRSFKLLIFHNIYFGNSINSSTDKNIFRVLALKQFFTLINSYAPNDFGIVVLGDFNISMINYSANSNGIYAPVLGEVLMLDSSGKEDLNVKGDSFIPMIKPHTLTTLGSKANKNSFDNILVSKKFESNVIKKSDNFKYGVFYEAKYKTNKESVEFLSDHYPVFFSLN